MGIKIIAGTSHLSVKLDRALLTSLQRRRVSDGNMTVLWEKETTQCQEAV
jgi:hypothetical protein